jgi:hypothetical protein
LPLPLPLPGAFSQGVKRLRFEAGTYLHQVPKFKDEWSYTSTHLIHLHFMVLDYIKGQLYLFTTTLKTKQSKKKENCYPVIRQLTIVLEESELQPNTCQNSWPLDAI